MADRNREADEGGEALDPEQLYSKEYCIGERLDQSDGYGGIAKLTRVL